MDLICFAVREEAKFVSRMEHIRVLITGMGEANARRKVHQAFEAARPRQVLTCGFAGALNPALRHNQVIFDAEPGSLMAAALEKCGAIPGQFYCSSRVLTLSAEKRALFASTRADAVEMESRVIREICAESGIPSATVRVISDVAAEDLPLDFNALMTSSHRINFWLLTLELIKSPGKIPLMRRFQKQTIAASRALGAVLTEFSASETRVCYENANAAERLPNDSSRRTG